MFISGGSSSAFTAYYLYKAVQKCAKDWFSVQIWTKVVRQDPKKYKSLVSLLVSFFKRAKKETKQLDKIAHNCTEIQHLTFGFSGVLTVHLHTDSNEMEGSISTIVPYDDSEKNQFLPALLSEQNQAQKEWRSTRFDENQYQWRSYRGQLKAVGTSWGLEHR